MRPRGTHAVFGCALATLPLVLAASVSTGAPTDGSNVSSESAQVSSAPTASSAASSEPAPAAVRKKKPALAPVRKASAPSASVSSTLSAPSTTPASSETPPSAPAAAKPLEITPVAPAKPSAELAMPTCSQEQLDVLVTALRSWDEALRGNEKRAYAEHECARDTVLCLDRFGQAEGDQLPDKLAVGQSVSVFAFVPSVDTAKLVVSTSVSSAFGESANTSEAVAPSTTNRTAPLSCELSRMQKATLRTAALPVAKLVSKPGYELLAIPLGAAGDEYWSSTPDGQIVSDWSAFASTQGQNAPSFVAIGSRVDVPSAESLSVDVARTERGSRHPCAEHHYDIAVDQGQYYLELAVLAPFVYKGDRKVQTHPLVGSLEPRLAVEEDWHVTAAVALDYFPAGRQRGQLTSFRNCRTRSCIENWFGVQAGLGLGSPFKEWYLGLLVEPVSGLNFGVGAALLKGEFLAPGRAEGMVVPEGDTSSANEKFMFRPYVGVSITQDIFNAIERAASSASQLF